MIRLIKWLISLFQKKQKPAVVISPGLKEYYGNPPADVDKAPWDCMAINPDGIHVFYQEKYGLLREVTCVGLWQNETQYRLTWKDASVIVLEKANIVSISIKKADL